MKPIEFDGVNVRIAEDQDEYQTLPSKKDPMDPQGGILTCWELDEADLEKIQSTKCVWLTLLTFNKPLQPIMLSTEAPELLTRKIPLPHQARVLQELVDLQQRRDRLELFTGTEEYKALPEKEQDRLQTQLNLMKQLAFVLEERVAAWA